MATSTAPKTTASVTKTGNTVQGRFTLKNLPTLDVTEASKPLFAVVGVADYAIEQAKDVPAQFKTLPSQVEKANKKALDLYTELTVRGERLVTQIRRQPSTQATIAEGKAAVKKAEAATRSAKRSVKAGEQAVEDAAAKIG